MPLHVDLPSLSFLKARIDEPELMDERGLAPDLVRDNLKDLRRVNSWLGGVKLTIAGLEHLTGDMRPGDELTILDVATGGVDIPARIIPWAAKRGLNTRIVATDVNPELLAIAAADAPSEIAMAVSDGRQLPFADDSFDIALCSLALHHLPSEDAVTMLAEMNRVARRGAVINDLVRCWHGYLGAWLLTRVATSPGSLTRYDAPLSVRRAYTRREMTTLARQAGFTRGIFDSFLGYRIAMTITSAQ